LPTSYFFPNIGGVEIALHNIAKRLLKKGHVPILLVPFGCYIKLFFKRHQFPYKIIPLPPKLTLFLLDPTKILINFLEVYFLALQKIFKFDIWHINVGYPIGVVSIRFASNHKIPHLVCCHGADIQIDLAIKYGLRLDPKVDEYIRRWLPQADALVAISNSVENEYKKIGIPDKKIARISNGVDLERFAIKIDRDSVRKTYSIESGDFVILSVGRYHSKKNFETLIKVAYALKVKADFSFKIIIAGPGNDKLQEDIDFNAVDDVVKIINPTDADVIPDELPNNKLLELYKISDVFVFPSFIETFGIVLIEAMSAGLPVITTDSPGCVDIVEHGRYGKIVSPLDIEQYVNDIISFKKNDDIANAYHTLSQERAAQFSWGCVVEKYCDLYVKIIISKQEDVNAHL